MDDLNVKKPRILCEQEFLKGFCEKRRTIGHTISSTDTLKKWDALFLSIRSSDLFLNFDQDELLEMLNEELNYYNQSTADSPLFQILKKQIDGGKLVNSESPLSDEFGYGDLEEDALNTIYLVADDDNSKTALGCSLGVCVIPIETCFDCNVMSSSTKIICKGKVFEWAEVFNKHIPKLNSLVLMDRYIVKPDKGASGFDLGNLYDILDVLIPDSLTVPFHLTLMTIIGENEKINELYHEINHHLIKAKPNTEIKLWIHPTTVRHFHDRAIFSSNLYVSCSSGFKLRGYGGKAINEGTITISPVGICGNIGEKQGWTNYYNIARSIIDDQNVKTYPKRNSSRLFIL